MRTPPEKIAAVAFDMDGLMFNTELLYEEVGGTLLQRRGKQVSRALLDEMMGRPSPVALQVMIDWHELTDSIQQLESETDEIFLALLPRRLMPLPGLMELLDALENAGIPRAVTTSSRRIFADQALEISGLRSRFEFILTCEDITRGKPDPEIYLKAAQRFGVSPSCMMVLEDSHLGSRAGVAADAWTIAVPGDHSRNHDFAHVAWVANTLGDPGIYRDLRLHSPGGP